MVQIEAPSTPECQEGVPSQGGQHREEHHGPSCSSRTLSRTVLNGQVDKVDLVGKNKG